LQHDRAGGTLSNDLKRAESHSLSYQSTGLGNLRVEFIATLISLMKCDRCENEATVHEVTIVNGVATEKNLCEHCAASDGIVPTPISEALDPGAVIAGPLAPVPAGRPGRASSCTSCRATLNDFKQCGLLGCPDCYATFRTHLTQLSARAHEGASRHIGRTPKRGGGTLDQAALIQEHAERLKRLHTQLDEAIASEQYERAARLRDEIRRVNSHPGEGQPSPSSHSKTGPSESKGGES
jgi:protein arginine kinase activator